MTNVPEWDLPGNSGVAEQRREAADRNALSHAMLFSGSGDLIAAARYAAAALECMAVRRPCGVCEACRKVRQGIHPDVPVVQDGEHKNIAVDVVRQVRGDAYIRPNEGARKVYIFPQCELLTETDQNVLLKIVEEGPPYAAFLFCAENPSTVLTTLRSRCVEWRLRPVKQTAAPQLSETAQALCRALGEKHPGGVAGVLVRHQKAKYTREQLQELLAQTRLALTEALLLDYRQGNPENTGKTAAYLAKNLTKTQMMRTIELLQNYWQQCFYNVSVSMVLGALTVELEGIL